MHQRPTFIVGTPRSGTTLLQAAIDSHPSVVGPPEIHYFFRIANLSDHYGDLRDEERLRVAVNDTLDSPLLHPLAIDAESVFKRASRNPTYAGLLDAVMMTIAESHGKSRWCEKTPGQPAAGIWKLFPEALVIHLVRHPVDVVGSLMRAPFNSESPLSLAREWLAFNLDSMQAGAGRPSQYLRIRYEDLVVEPEAALRSVCNFLDEPFATSMIADRQTSMAVTEFAWWQHAARQGIDGSRIGAGGQTLGARGCAQVAAVVTNHIRDFGYVVPPGGFRAWGRVLNKFEDGHGRRTNRERQRVSDPEAVRLAMGEVLRRVDVPAAVQPSPRGRWYCRWVGLQ